MSDLRRVSAIACVMVVVLRLSVGWQFVYEGLWKLSTMQTASPWTAEGYLKNAVGPFRGIFRTMSGDPDDLDWLDADKVTAKWGEWHDLLVSHYDLNEKQKASLKTMLNGPDEFLAELEQLPEGIEFRGSVGKAIRFDAKRKRLIVPGDWHMIPQERDRLLALVTVEENPSEANKAQNELAKAYQKAIRDVYARSSRLSFKERLTVLLKGDPERVGLIQEQYKGTIDYKRIGNIELYKEQLKRYEADLAKARITFEHTHLARQFSELQSLKSEAVGPVKALDAELKTEATKLLEGEQLSKGPVSMPLERMDLINMAMMWSLTVIGALLITGLFTRLSSLAAAGLLLSFWLSFPPLPGVHGIPGPEHSYIINKNLIECIAMLTIATMPSGRWFGLDALVRRFILRKKSD